MNIDGPEMTAKMMAWPVALNGSSNELFPGRMHPLQLFSSPNHGSGAPTALSGQIEQAGRISCNTCELDLTLIKVYIEALRRKKKRFPPFFSFPPSSHRSIVCIRPHDDPAVWDWSVLISHGPISFDQSQICPTDPFPISRLSSAILIVDRRHVWKLDNRGKSVYTHGGDAAEQSFVVDNDRECSFGAQIVE